MGASMSTSSASRCQSSGGRVAPPARFCPQCGGALGRADGCDACGWILFRDPKLSAVVLVNDAAGRLLYVRRNHEPAMFKWAWPSGFVDAGERVEDAAAREVREETGIEIRLERLLGVWSQTGEDVVVIGYAATLAGGTLKPGVEALAAGWFPMGRLPRPVFPHDDAILRSFIAPER